MSSVKSSNTGLEKNLFSLLKKNGVGNFTKHPKNIPGKPDLAFKKLKIAVFIDSCFWHGCPSHLRMPKSNRGYWTAKIERNIARDKEVRALLRRNGWSVLQIWEHDLAREKKYIGKIKRKIDERSGAEYSAEYGAAASRK